MSVSESVAVLSRRSKPTRRLRDAPEKARVVRRREELGAEGVDEVHGVGRREGQREVVAAVALHQGEVIGELARA